MVSTKWIQSLFHVVINCFQLLIANSSSGLWYLLSQKLSILKRKAWRQIESSDYPCEIWLAFILILCMLQEERKKRQMKSMLVIRCLDAHNNLRHFIGTRNWSFPLRCWHVALLFFQQTTKLFMDPCKSLSNNQWVIMQSRLFFCLLNFGVLLKFGIFLLQIHWILWKIFENQKKIHKQSHISIYGSSSSQNYTKTVIFFLSYFVNRQIWLNLLVDDLKKVLSWFLYSFCFLTTMHPNGTIQHDLSVFVFKTKYFHVIFQITQ